MLGAHKPSYLGLSPCKRRLHCLAPQMTHRHLGACVHHFHRRGEYWGNLGGFSADRRTVLLAGTLLGHFRRPALKSLRYFRPWFAASWDARRLARRLACRVISAFTRVFDAHDTPNGCLAQHPNVSRRSAHPSIRVSEAKVAKPRAQENAPRERDGLFEK